MKVYISSDYGEKEVAVEIHCNCMDSRVKRLERYISDYEETICGHKDGEHMYINIHDILYFEAVDNKCFLYSKITPFV